MKKVKIFVVVSMIFLFFSVLIETNIRLKSSQKIYNCKKINRIWKNQSDSIYVIEYIDIEDKYKTVKRNSDNVICTKEKITLLKLIIM